MLHCLMVVTMVVSAILFNGDGGDDGNHLTMTLVIVICGAP